ncbi:unnamed protein product [Owenia fusiformis]|uniref:Uncharacterized protein n=1 Tax=Owenia fusiformis TaxID=6347 RepID=A0A8J1TG79_OWEFU|nr:unnamed protein product [Owenia fusiformis]
MDPHQRDAEAVGCCAKSNLDTDDIGKATTFWLFSIKRPHMRAFHASWFGFFVAFLGWFCVQPLIPKIKEDLGLKDEEIANSGIAAVAAVIVIRICAGPLCDRFGARRVMIGLLVAGSIPVGLTGLVTNGLGLIIVRLFIGILGGVFVPCQMWTINMFSDNIVGSANALAGGWGNLGGGVTFLLMPLLYQLVSYSNLSPSAVWKVTLVIPASVGLILAIPYWFFTDDCPQGPWHLRKTRFANEVKYDTKKLDGHVNKAYSTSDSENENNTELSVTAVENNGNLSVSGNKKMEAQQDGWRGNIGLKILTIIILFVQYAACFGVEISVNSNLNIYLLRKFKKPGCNITDLTGKDSYSCSVLTAETASLITSLFGLMNLFARFTGGFLSDVCNKRWNLSGRILVHFTVFLLQGTLMIIFGQMDTIPSAIAVLIFWSMCVQNAEGTTYSLVPFVLPERVGIVAGIVAAGGNVGGICWNTLWRFSLDNMSQYFTIIGSIVIGTALLNIVLFVGGYHITDPLCQKQNENTTGGREAPEEDVSEKQACQIVSCDSTKL